MSAQPCEFIQFDLFDKKTEMDLLREEMRAVHDTCNNVRRGAFGKLNGLGKMISELSNKMDRMENRLKKIEVALPEID